MLRVISAWSCISFVLVCQFLCCDGTFDITETYTWLEICDHSAQVNHVITSRLVTCALWVRSSQKTTGQTKRPVPGGPWSNKCLKGVPFCWAFSKALVDHCRRSAKFSSLVSFTKSYGNPGDFFKHTPYINIQENTKLFFDQSKPSIFCYCSNFILYVIPYNHG